MPSLLALILLATALCSAEEAGISEQVDAAARRYEEQLARDFAFVQPSLERWLASRRSSAVGEAVMLLPKAGPVDQVVIAWHILAVNPKHKTAREVFTKLGIKPPFDEQGVADPAFKAPGSADRGLLEKLAGISCPPFQVVREVVDVKSAHSGPYWRAMAGAKKTLVATMIGLAKKGSPDLVYPQLAYYDPTLPEVKTYFATRGKPVPRQRWWANHIDGWLLDRELAGIDCGWQKPDAGSPPPKDASWSGEGSWTLPEVLKAVRIEAVLGQGRPSFSIQDAAGAGVTLAIQGAKLSVSEGTGTVLASFASEVAAGSAPLPVQFEVRGRKVLVLVAGGLLGSCELAGDHAWRQVVIQGGGATFASLRVRFLAPRQEPAAPVAAKPETPPAEAPWLAQRKLELDKKVSFQFEDTPLDEVVTLLARLSGAKLSLDERGMLLKDLPVTLNAKDLRLGAALEWLRKVTDLDYQTGPDGIILTWKR